MDMQIISHISNEYFTSKATVLAHHPQQDLEFVASDTVTRRLDLYSRKIVENIEKSGEENPAGVYLFDLGDKRLSILQDEASHRFIYRQIDSDTDRVRKQFPYESELARVAFLRETSVDKRV